MRIDRRRKLPVTTLLLCARAADAGKDDPRDTLLQDEIRLSRRSTKDGRLDDAVRPRAHAAASSSSAT